MRTSFFPDDPDGRIKQIRHALGDERIDIVTWPDSDRRRIRHALAPHSPRCIDVDGDNRMTPDPMALEGEHLADSVPHQR